MPSPPFLDFDVLTAPIAGPNPAGDPVPFTTRKKLDDARKEVNPSRLCADDPLRPEQPVPADWPGIERLATATLTETSKDLLVAARLTEALVKQYGFGGLRDGLHLLNLLVTDCWDRINPVIEDGDLEVRAAAFNWLDDELRGSRFPNTMRTVPLVSVEAGGYGWQQWRESQETNSKISRDALDKAIAATPREFCQVAADDLAQSEEELTRLVETLNEKMGEAAPGLVTVKKALADCQALAGQILERKGPAPVSAPEPEESPGAAEGEAGPSDGKAPVVKRALTREDVYAQLADVAALLMRLEPQSPVVYLVQRAVKLSQLPFPQLMKVLIRDASVLGELNRDLDLGIDESEPTSEE